MDPNYYDHTSDMLEFVGVFVCESEKAICVDFGDGDQWFPRSISTMKPTDPEEGMEVLVFLPEWFAKKEGLM
jgi:hypothetical protein